MRDAESFTDWLTELGNISLDYPNEENLLRFILPFVLSRCQGATLFASSTDLVVFLEVTSVYWTIWGLIDAALQSTVYPIFVPEPTITV